MHKQFSWQHLRSSYASLSPRIPSGETILLLSGKTKDPIDILGIIEDLGIKVEPISKVEHIKSIYALSFIEENQAFIQINTYHSPLCQRLFMAQHLCHILFHPSDSAYLNDFGYSFDYKNLSNRSLTTRQSIEFAAQILIPSNSLEKSINVYGYSPFILSKLFHVPLCLMEKRLLM